MSMNHRITTDRPEDRKTMGMPGTPEFDENRRRISAAFSRGRLPMQRSLSETLLDVYRTMTPTTASFTGVKSVESRVVPNHVFKTPALLKEKTGITSDNLEAVGALDKYTPEQLATGLDRLLDDMADMHIGEPPITHMSEQQARDLEADCTTDA